MKKPKPPTDEAMRSSGTRPGQDQNGETGPAWGDIPSRVWIVAVIAAVLLFALFGFWGLYLFRGRFGSQEAPTPTAIIWTLAPSPTSSPAAASALPTPTLTAAPEEPEAETPTSTSDIAVGGQVQVSGTGGLGLSLREGPGANYTRMGVAAEGEIFVVVEGPHMTADSPWWRIRDPDDPDREWWAIGNYLEPVAQP